MRRNCSVSICLSFKLAAFSHLYASAWYLPLWRVTVVASPLAAPTYIYQVVAAQFFNLLLRLCPYGAKGTETWQRATGYAVAWVKEPCGAIEASFV